MNKPEIEAEKENFDDLFPFDTNVDELEKLMEGAPVNGPANTAKNTDGLTITESWESYRQELAIS